MLLLFPSAHSTSIQKWGLLSMHALFNSTFYAERHPQSGVSQYNHIPVLLATKQLCRSNWSNPRPKSSQLDSFEFKMQLDVLAAYMVKFHASVETTAELQSCLSGDFLSNSAFFTSLLIIPFWSAFLYRGNIIKPFNCAAQCFCLIME